MIGFSVRGLLAGWILLHCLLSPSMARGAEHVRVSGREYVPIADWARENGFAIQWAKREEIAQLANANTIVRLEVHSPEAPINGVAVRLLFPPSQHAGTSDLSRLDVQATFAPILAPPKSRPRSTLK